MSRMTVSERRTLLTLVVNAPASEDWHVDALCREIGPGLFFPEQGESTREAKRVCAACPVRAECLEDALARDEEWGVWGGMTRRERTYELRRRGRTAANSPVTTPGKAA